MDENNSSALPPPLDLISVESLPKELAVLNEEFGIAVTSARVTIGYTVLTGLFALAYSAVTFLMLIGQAPLAIIVIASLMSIGFLTPFSWFLRKSIREVRACKQMKLSPQLLIEAEEETVRINTAKMLNLQAADWNSTAAAVVQHNLDGVYLQTLNKQRAVLSSRIDRIKKLAKRAGKLSK